MDLLGALLKKKFHFKGKWRLVSFWGNHFNGNINRVAALPGGLKVKVDLRIPYERMVYLQLEEWNDLLYISKKLKKGDNFIDVGSNIGIWSLVAGKSVGPTGKVFSFEPNPATFEKLKENVSLNNFEEIIEISQIAVSDKNDIVNFSCEIEHNNSAISNINNSKNIKVKTVSLDSIFYDLEIRGMKLDTEGYEMKVLRGALNIIKRFQPFLIIEFNTTLLPSKFLRDWDVYILLQDLKYLSFSYDKQGNETLIDGSFSLNGYTNILFVPSTNL